jgi:uncharacterized protein YecT (DUF1311 family)
VLRRVGLALVLVAAGGFVRGADGALRPPTLPTTAGPHSVARFPCPKKPTSTIAIEACQARRLLRLGRTFNSEAAVLWSVFEVSGRRAFVRAHRAWLTYRRRQCEIEAAAFSGGTAAPVAFGACELRLTAARVNELGATIKLYCQGRERAGRFRRCPR